MANPGSNQTKEKIVSSNSWLIIISVDAKMLSLTNCNPSTTRKTLQRLERNADKTSNTTILPLCVHLNIDMCKSKTLQL